MPEGLTLDNLVWLANNQLTRLHGRYLLQRKASEALELEVVDTWQADAVRDTRTLSGGELPRESGAGAGVVRSGQPQNPN